MSAHPDAGELAAEIRRRLGPAPEIPDWPLVSIVVLNRDGAELLRQLLSGLIERTDYPRLELVLVDNASTDDSLEYVRAVDAPFPITILANAHNESFSDACNQGAEVAAGEYLLFLNNDADPFEPGWLRELVACLLGSGASAVGPTLIQPAQNGQAGCGYVVHQRGLRARQEGSLLLPAYRDHLLDPLGEWLGEDTETITIVAACLLLGRAAFDRVGGFSRGYWYGPEDVDLGLKLRERGMTARCSGRSLLIHPPNSTLDAIPDRQRAEWLRGNRRLFAERWGPRVRREFELDRLRGGGLWAEPDDPAVERSSSREEVEALGFCIKAAQGEDGAESAALLESLAAALRRRGHRCLVQSGAEAEAQASLEYDVAVHLAGRSRYAPKPAQLNVLWCEGDPEALPEVERAHYDVVIDDELDESPAAVERFAERLLATAAEHAEANGYRTRIDPV